MVEAIKFWNEPNNLSHWDFTIDPEWDLFTEMVRPAAIEARKLSPDTKLVLGGISPIDPGFIKHIQRRGLLDYLDAVAVHGFPLDWNHWKLKDWPKKISEIEDISHLPVWVTEVGVSSFGADEVQTFGLQKTTELLLHRVERVFWYSLLDLPPTWPATTRHKENEGSAYYRHFYMGLISANGEPKEALKYFNKEMGIVQWLHFEDHRLDYIVKTLKELGIKKLRTGISWADWHRPNATEWFDKQMEALEDFDLTITLCFTPPSRGIKPDHTSPPLIVEEFSWFTSQVIKRYISKKELIEKNNGFDLFS